LRRALNEGTLRAFHNADSFTTFKIFRRPGFNRKTSRVCSRSFLGLLPATVGDTDAKAMSSLLVIVPAKGNRIIQILSAINYRFLVPNSR